MYEARVSDKFSYGHRTFYGETLGEIKNILSKYLFDTGSTIKIYEVKEVKIEDEDDWCERWDFTKYEYKNDWGSKTLYEDACINKDQVTLKI